MKKTVIIQLLLCLAAVSSFAQFSSQINLNSADVIFAGESPNDLAGWHIADAGDVNHDGIADILIAAPKHDSDGNIDNGKVYLVFGKSSGWNHQINLAEANASFIGETSGDESSNDIFGVGDINDDNIDDFAVGVKRVDEGGTSAGKVYIFFGRTTGWAKNTPISDADVTILGEGATSEAGHVYPVGDINGDGFNDIIIGAGYNDEAGFNAGKVYVYFGKTTAAWTKIDTIFNADASYMGEFAGDQAGHRVAGAGDVNGDGLNDFIVGANGRDQDNVINRGICYIILGRTTGWAKNISLANADASFLGSKDAKLELGYNITGAGDVNGDGLDDLLLAGGGKSKIFLLFGKTTGWTVNQSVEKIANVIFSGENGADYAGGDMRSLGDINDDGFADFIIGAYGNDQNGKDAGKVYLYYGRATWPHDMNLVDANATFIGEHAGDLAGFSVAGGGDYDRDGNEDVLISAIQNDASGVDAGAVYLFFSRMKPFVLTSPNGAEAWDIGAAAIFQWQSKTPQGNIRIELSRNNGSSWDVLMTVPDNGSASWTVTGPASSQCLVRITQIATGEIDQSNATFRIAEASLTVQTPNGGELWYQGEVRNISWVSAGSFTKVKIEYSVNNGSTWNAITDSTENDGLYAWTLPAEESKQCLVRIQDARDGQPVDASNAEFEIAKPPASLIIIVPNGGEIWPLGSTQNIAWTSAGTSGTVKIELSRDSGATWETLAAAIPDNHIFPWLVTEPGSQICLVRISDSISGQTDISDAVFTISTSNPLIHVLVPNGGEIWEIDKSSEIKWTSTNGSGNVKIEISRNNGSTWSILSSSTPDDGSEMWLVTGPVSNQCLIKIRDISGGVEDHSDAVFSISGAAQMSVVAPNGGEDWPINTQQNITWYTINPSLNVNIYLSRNDGTTWEFLSNEPDNGSWAWTVTGPVSENCKVLVSHMGGTPNDMSDANFKISEAPSITVLSPVGGENWQIGSVQEITWSSQKTSGAVKIDISRDNGTAWDELVTWTENDGQYLWKVTGHASQHCLIRIRDNAGPAVGTSAAVFTISEIPTLTLTSPNGGEIWFLSTVHEITWNSTQPGEDINIYLSRNNGLVYEFLERTPDDGRWEWQVQGPQSDSCVFLISTVSGSLFDLSDSMFQVTEAVVIPTVTVLVPNGGETWFVGDDHEIRWATENAGDFVKIEISRDNGADWELVELSTEDDSVFEWTVSGPPSDQCRIRVSTADGNAYDLNDTTFTIAGKPAITVIHPAKGEVWVIDQEHEITWDAQYLEADVMIELSRNSGETWESITDRAENDGSYLWTVLGPEASQCLIRITDVNYTVSDICDSLFVIQLSGGIAENVEHIKTYALEQNYPNPFNPGTSITFQCPKQARVTLDIYNVMGHHVRRVAAEVFDSGSHCVQWDGRAQQGDAAPSGFYFCRMTAEGFQQTVRMLLLK